MLYEEHLILEKYGGYEDQDCREIFFNGLSSDLRPLYCGLHMCYPEMNVIRYFDHWLLVSVKSGTGIIYADNRTQYEVGPRHAFLMTPNREYNYIANKSDPWVYAWIGFDGSSVTHLIERTEFYGRNTVIKLSDDTLTNILWNNAEACLATKDIDLQRMIAVAALHESMKYLITTCPNHKEIRASTLSDYTRIALQIIKAHYNDELTVTYIANKLGVSRTYFSKIFTQETGISCVQYLSDYRISRAKALLETTDAQIQKIAEQVGIPDYIYFSRLFRKKVGVTPSIYRKFCKK